MKRLVSVLAVCAVAGIPLTALAATLNAAPEYTLAVQKWVDGNLYVAAGTATIGGSVTGDVVAAGGTVSVTGAVGGDILAGGGTIAVLGPVGGDVRVLGGNISFNNRIGGDVVIAGGSVHLLPGAVVQGDLIVAGGQVILDGTVNKTVRMAGGALSINGSVAGDVTAKIGKKFMLGPTARIGGDLSYSGPSKLTMSEGATVAGVTTYNPRGSYQLGENAGKRALWAVVAVVTGMQLLAALGLAALLVWRWRRPSLELMAQAQGAFWQSLGRGLVYGILVPIAAVLLLVSFVGILPGVLLLLAYIAAMILTKAFAGMLIGSWLVMAVKKRPAMHLTWGSALGGVILLRLVTLIPVVGWIISALACLVMFGVIAHAAQKQLSA